MTNELLSALMDGECSTVELNEILREAAESEELMREWSRMNLVRDAMAGRPLPASSEADADVFCSSVMSRLGEIEPVQPAKLVPFAPVPGVMPTAAPARPMRVRRQGRRSLPLVGWAAAASVTLVALAGGRAWIGNGASSPDATAVASSAAPSPVAAQERDVRPVSNTGEGHFGLIPVSSNMAAVRWSHFDPDTGRPMTNPTASDRMHLHLEMGGGRMPAYIQAANGASYETVSDPH